MKKLILLLAFVGITANAGLLGDLKNKVHNRMYDKTYTYEPQPNTGVQPPIRKDVLQDIMLRSPMGAIMQLQSNKG